MRAAVVTGASSGIGAASAAALAGAGFAVAGLDLRPAAGCALSVELDVTDAEAVEAAVARAERELGPVEALVTSAGYYEQGALGELGEARWRRMLEVHVGGTVAACRAVYRRMLPRGAGRIVAIGSELALIGDETAPHYAAAKGAIHAFAKSLALEAAPHGIQVNCVAPGPTDTPLMTEELRDPAYVEALPLRRLVAPAEVAATVRFLVADEHTFVGQVLSPNAGAAI